ncbi:MAG: energy transducer TonB [bacterium]
MKEMNKEINDTIKERKLWQFAGFYKWGLAISIILHGAIIAAFLMPRGGGEESKIEKKHHKIKVQVKYDELPPPPSIMPMTEVPTGLPAEGSVGEVPMPVPDELAEKSTITDYIPGVEGGVPGGTELEVTDIEKMDWEGASVEHIEFVAYDQAPQFKRKVEPEYPAIGREGGVEGTVGLMVYVAPDGLVKNVIVTQPMEIEAFNQAAVDAAYQCTFTPALQNGKPIGVWIAMPVNFKMK